MLRNYELGKFEISSIKKIALKLSKKDRKLVRLARNSTSHVPDGLAVRICGSHAQGPGSTPGLETFSTPILRHFLLNY